MVKSCCSVIQSPVTDSSSLPPSLLRGSPRRPWAPPTAPLLPGADPRPPGFHSRPPGEVLREGPRADLSQATGEEGRQPPVPLQPHSWGRGAVPGAATPASPPPPWEELQRVPRLRHPPRGASLPRVPPLLPVSLLRPSSLAGLAAPCPSAGGRGGSPEGFPAPACLCQNGWWVERGSGVARLEGDSLWELGDVISPKEAPATRR